MSETCGSFGCCSGRPCRDGRRQSEQQQAQPEPQQPVIQATYVPEAVPEAVPEIVQATVVPETIPGLESAAELIQATTVQATVQGYPVPPANWPADNSEQIDIIKKLREENKHISDNIALFIMERDRREAGQRFEVRIYGSLPQEQLPAEIAAATIEGREVLRQQQGVEVLPIQNLHTLSQRFDEFMRLEEKNEKLRRIYTTILKYEIEILSEYARNMVRYLDILQETPEAPLLPLQLPPGWEKVYDEIGLRFYYRNYDSRVTQFEVPAGTVPVATEAAIREAAEREAEATEAKEKFKTYDAREDTGQVAPVSDISELVRLEGENRELKKMLIVMIKYLISINAVEFRGQFFIAPGIIQLKSVEEWADQEDHLDDITAGALQATLDSWLFVFVNEEMFRKFQASQSAEPEPQGEAGAEPAPAAAAAEPEPQTSDGGGYRRLRSGKKIRPYRKLRSVKRSKRIKSSKKSKRMRSYKRLRSVKRSKNIRSGKRVKSGRRLRSGRKIKSRRTRK